MHSFQELTVKSLTDCSHWDRREGEWRRFGKKVGEAKWVGGKVREIRHQRREAKEGVWKYTRRIFSVTIYKTEKGIKGWQTAKARQKRNVGGKKRKNKMKRRKKRYDWVNLTSLISLRIPHSIHIRSTLLIPQSINHHQLASIYGHEAQRHKGPCPPVCLGAHSSDLNTASSLHLDQI